MPDNIFLHISALLAITVSIAFLIRLMRQPLVIAYIVAGALTGPLFLDLMDGKEETYELFARFGVALLLFIIGLHLDIRQLRHIGKAATLTGAGQVVFTVIFGTIILRLLGFAFAPSIYLALAITFSSTIIITKLLSDKKDTETVYGQHTIGLMVVQDIIAVIVIVALGVIGQQQVDGSALGGSFAELFVKGILVLGIVYLTARYFLPAFVGKIAASSELLFLFTVAWCFGIASLVSLAGFSLEIGAIIAGLTLGSSPYQPEISSRIKPLRDFFLILFFIVLGSNMVLTHTAAIWVPSIALSLFILIGNPLILYLIFRWLKFTRRNSLLAGLTAAQVSEFGFVLLYTGERVGLVSGEIISIFTVVAITTIFFSSYLIIYNEQIYRFCLPFFALFGPDKFRQATTVTRPFDAWVVGYHRIGWKVCEALRAMKLKFAVIDYNPEALRQLRRLRTPSYFGDIADVEFLASLSLRRARLVIMTIPAEDDQITLIGHLKNGAGSKTMIIANAYDYAAIERLYRAGADYVMTPHLLGGQWISEMLKRKTPYARLFKTLKKEQAKLLTTLSV